MEVFVARFPVFDKTKCLFGYELAFRDGFEEYYEAINAGKASVDLMAFVNFGELCETGKGFVAFDRRLLMMEFPLLFAPQSMVISLPGDIEASASVLARCADLKKRGYTIAVRQAGESILENPLLASLGIVGLDFPAMPAAIRQKICQVCNRRDIRVLAGNLPNEVDFKQAIPEGFTLFAGAFFTTPDAKPQPGKLQPNKLRAMQLLKEVNDPEISYEELSEHIQCDVGMTYGLLKLINSAWFGLRHEVKCVRQAIVLLGPAEIRRWVSMLTMHQACQDKPVQLLKLALTRAKFAEHMALLAGMPTRAPEIFLLGMFSVLDAIMDRPMKEIVREVALSEAIRATLLGEKSEFRPIYEALLAYEHGQWVLFSDLAAKMGIHEEDVPLLFRKSLAWAESCLSAGF